MSKTDHYRHLLDTVGWWHDPEWGVQAGKTFRAWANRNWRATKGFHGPSNARDYNTHIKALRLRGAA